MVSCGSSRDCTDDVGLRHRPDRALEQRRSVSADRVLEQRPVAAPLDPRLISTSRSALSQTEMPLTRIAVAGVGVHEGAAAGRQHLRAALQQPRDHARLAGAEIGLAVVREDFGDGHAGGASRSRRRHRRTECRAAPPAGGRPTTCRRPSCRPARSSGGRARARARACGCDPASLMAPFMRDDIRHAILVPNPAIGTNREPATWFKTASANSRRGPECNNAELVPIPAGRWAARRAWLRGGVLAGQFRRSSAARDRP